MTPRRPSSLRSRFPGFWPCWPTAICARLSRGSTIWSTAMKQEGIVGVADKMDKGKIAIADLAAYKAAKKSGDSQAAEATLARFTANQEFLGYGYLESTGSRPCRRSPPPSIRFISWCSSWALSRHFSALSGLCRQRHHCRQEGACCGSGSSRFSWPDRLPVRLGGGRGRPSALGHPGPAAGQQWPPPISAAGSVQATFFMFLALFTVLLHRRDQNYAEAD